MIIIILARLAWGEKFLLLNLLPPHENGKRMPCTRSSLEDIPFAGILHDFLVFVILRIIISHNARLYFAVYNSKFKFLTRKRSGGYWTTEDLRYEKEIERDSN